MCSKRGAALGFRPKHKTPQTWLPTAIHKSYFYDKHLAFVRVLIWIRESPSEQSGSGRANKNTLRFYFAAMLLCPRVPSPESRAVPDMANAPESRFAPSRQEGLLPWSTGLFCGGFDGGVNVETYTAWR